MNFKKSYKSANDKLCADHMIIDEIFEKAHKKPKTIYVYRSVLAAMAAVLFFVSIYAINNKPRTNTLDNAVVYKKNVPETQHNTSDQSINENVSKESGNMTNPKSRGAIFDTADDSLAKEEFETASSGGGMNSTMLKAGKGNLSEEYISKKDYFDYLGFGFNEDIVLSNGMNIHYPENYRIVRDTEGNITDDSSVFTISCENSLDATATLTAGKINPPVLCEDKYKIILDTKVCITETDDNLSADFIIGNSWCSLVGTGLNHEEFTVLISEILANKICQ